VEIGPGRGALTDLLAERASRVVAIEIDRDLAGLLRKRYEAAPHVHIVTGDALELDWRELAGGPYLLAGNVPYYITSPLLFKALEFPRPGRAVFLVQREVAERIVATPGSGDYGALSINVQVAAHAEVRGIVRAAAFLPPPNVDSAIVVMTPREPPLVPEEEEDGFRAFVQRLFGMRRKQILRALRDLFGLEASAAESLLMSANVAPKARAETLTPETFVELYRLLRSNSVVVSKTDQSL
jgi:16S rRNA (adenine1518-N6/adenine1519-N6)-dimethyltransferase